jgi:hypothetical protein
MKIEMHWSDRFLSVTATVDSLEEATRVNHWLRSLGGQTTPAEDAPAWVTEDVVDAEEVAEIAPTPAAAKVAAPAPATAPATAPVTRDSVRAAVVNRFNVPEVRARIREILATFGAARLSELPDEHLEAFAAALEKIQ